MSIQVLSYKDFYKCDHRRQYPEGSEDVYSNGTFRGSRIAGINQTVVFGLQAFIKRFLIKEYNEKFFNVDRDIAVGRYKRRLDNALGKDAVPMDHVHELHKIGYLPLHIKGLEEGTLVPMRIPSMTIRATDKRFFWLTNDMETLYSCENWKPMTVATLAFEYRQLIDDYIRETSDEAWFADWQGHDFSFRGMSGVNDSMVCGAAHLLSFCGTDTIPAIDFLEEYYGANSDKEMIGGSVYATEHSVMCMGGKETEEETYKRLLTKVYPKGIVSIVSDTWDFWKVIEETLPSIKDLVMSRDGKLVIRPDSGDPIKIICGDPASDNPFTAKGLIQCLYEIFGGKVNSKGYKQLDSHIGAIYGDSITLARAREILRQLKAKGFASSNVVFGIGSYTYQYVTRDTFGFAIKSTYGVINGKPVELYKQPKTDSGLKNSAKGLLQVYLDNNNHICLKEGVTPEEEKEGLLQTVFLDGKLYNETTLSKIRTKLKSQVKIHYPEPKVQYDG